MIRYSVGEPTPAELLDRAVTRNAQLVTALRHATAEIHRSALGHTRTVSWVVCHHEDCRKVAALVGDWKAPPVPVPTR